MVTVEYNITQYNNTAVTNHQIIYGNYRSLDPAVAERDYSMADPVIGQLFRAFGQEQHYGTMLFLNETTAIAPNGIEITSPTAYNAYSFFQYWTLDDNKDGQGDCTTDVTRLSELGDPHNAPTITLSTTLYQVAGGALDYTKIKTIGDIGLQSFPQEFHQYILSNSALLASYPFLKSCTTLWAHGIPSVKVRVSTLTATSYNTIIGSGTFTASSPDATLTPSTSAVPGSTLKAPAVPSTTAQPKQASPSSNTPVDIPSTPSESHPTSIMSSPPAASANPSTGGSKGPPLSPSVFVQLSQPSIVVPATAEKETASPIDTGTFDIYS